LLAELDAGATVLAPTRELAAAIFDAIERRHLAAGRDIWPTPRIRDFGSWLREQHERRFVTGAARLRCMEDIEERYLWREILAEDGRDAGLLDPQGAAAAARRARRTMRDHGIASAALAAAGGEEAERLAGWIHRFERRCRDLGCIGQDDLLAALPAAPEAVAWIDSPAWRPAARRWLESNGRSMLAPAAAGPALAWECPARSPDAELAAAADWLRVRLSQQGQFRAWVLIPDLAARRAEVADAFDAALAPRRFRLDGADASAPYAIAGGTPLADYPHVAAALEWLAMTRGPVSFERFSALLRAFGPQPGGAATAQLALIDAELRAAAPAHAPLRGWVALAQDIARRRGTWPCAPLVRLAAVRESLEEASGAARMSAWIGRWTRAFDAGPWAVREHWSSAEYQSVERMRELFASLAAADSLFGALTGEAAGRLLASAARDTVFQPQTGITPIWISGAVGDPWLGYDALWIAGLSADAWPAPIEPVPLLPVALQRLHGVEAASAAARLRTAIDLGRRWTQRAATVVFSLADPGEGHAAIPSPLLPAPLRLLECVPTPRPLWQELHALAPRLELLHDVQAPPLGGEESPRGVATLRAQSLCAFRGFAASRLRCERLARPIPGFNALERGTVVHGALERIWRELGDSTALHAIEPAARSALIAAAVAASIEESAARRDPGSRWRRRERERTERLLSRWLDLEARRTPFWVERIEAGCQVARHAGLEFSCRIDRVDRLADGGRVLIDYKTGVAAADWRGERPANPQLPLYATLTGGRLVAVAYGQVSAAECRFVVESDRDGALLPERRRTPLEGARDMQELLALWRVRLDRLAGEFRDGRAEVDPAPRACESCHLQAFCRVGDAESGDPESEVQDV